MNATTPSNLHTWSGQVKTIASALNLCAERGATIGFFYAPSVVPRFFKLDTTGRPMDENNKLVPIESAYELRLFDAHCDVRLLLDGACWRVAVLGEDANLPLPAALSLGPPRSMIASATQCHDYLLWGKTAGTPSQNGWTRLTAARIGGLWVPYNLSGSNTGVAMTAQEYFEKPERGDGNVVYAAERLTGFAGFVRTD